MATPRVVLLQPFLRSFLAGVLAATAVGLGLLVTLTVLSAGEEPLFDIVLSTAAVVAFVVGTPVTGSLVGLTVARHAGGRLRGLGSGLLAGATGQFIILVCTVVALSVATVGTSNALVLQAEDGLSAAEFTVALMTLVPAALTAGLVALAASGPTTGADDPFGYAAPRARGAASGPPDLDDGAGGSAGGGTDANADLADLADAPDATGTPAPSGPSRRSAPRTLTCPRCHTPNKVPRDGGRMTCRECGLIGRPA